MDLNWWATQFWRDTAAFGLKAATSNMRRVIPSPLTAIGIPEYKKIYIRPFDSDYATIFQVFGQKEYHVSVPNFQKRLSERYQSIIDAGRDPIIVDAGANIGAASLWFRLLYPRAKIVAIEPDPENVKVLKLNVDPYLEISVCEAALGSSPGYAQMARKEQSWALTTQRALGGCEIMTVNDAIKSIPNGEPFLIKIDIEGFERDVFSVNTDWIDNFAGIFIEPHDWLFPGEGISKNLQRAMAGRDFEFFINGENIIYVRLNENPRLNSN